MVSRMISTGDVSLFLLMIYIDEKPFTYWNY